MDENSGRVSIMKVASEAGAEIGTTESHVLFHCPEMRLTDSV